MKRTIGLLFVTGLVFIAGCTASTTVHLQNNTNTDETAIIEVGKERKKYIIGTIPPGGEGSCELEWLWDTGFPTTCSIRTNNRSKTVTLDNYRNSINKVDLYFRIEDNRIVGPAFSPLPKPRPDYPEGGDASPVQNFNGPGPQNIPAAPPTE